MNHRWRLAFLAAWALAGSPLAPGLAQEGVEGPDGWRGLALREEIAPRFGVDKAPAGQAGAYLLCQAGRGHEAVDGRWVRTQGVQGGKHYAFRAEYRASQVDTPRRCVLARVIWLDGAGKQLSHTEYPANLALPVAIAAAAETGDWPIIAGTYQAPLQATQARIELHFRWSARGEVAWRPASLLPCDPPAPRIVRLGVVNHRPRGGKTARENLEQFVKPLEEAAALRADIVCLGEAITTAGSARKPAQAAESVPGESTEFLGQLAKRGQMYLVTSLYERDGQAVYNTAVLIGRDGRLAGKYRKVCLPYEEIDVGVTPGQSYPVFETDFGRVGMMICWDVHFPEVARELAARGAEVICLPIWGGNETLAQARAIENQLFLAASGYDFKSGIFDKTGRRLAPADRDPAQPGQANRDPAKPTQSNADPAKAGPPAAKALGDPGVLVVPVDLSRQELWPWLGDWRSRIWREGPAR